MLVKWSVQQDFELVSSVLVQFATQTGRQKGNPKGVDETLPSPTQCLYPIWGPKLPTGFMPMKFQISIQVLCTTNKPKKCQIASA